MAKGTAVAAFDPGAMPAHIAAFLDDKQNNNIVDRGSVPTLTTSGKGTWVIALNGEKTVLTRKNEDGDDVNVTLVRAIILDYAKDRGRAYYEGTYDPAKVSAPLCWSDDGKKPHASVEEPQHKTCDGCPKSVKGSRVTDQNKAVTACAQHRMVAVAIANKLDVLPALRLKLAITSDWDKDNKEEQAQGWYAFRQYLDYLRSRGISNTAAVITKIKFDNSETYPKLLFSVAGWNTPEALVRAVELAKEDETQKLLAGSWTPAGADGKATETAKALPPDEDDQDGPAPAPAPAKTGKAKPVAKAPAAPSDDDDDADQDVIPPSKPSPKADAAKPVNASAATANPKRAAAAAAAKAAAEAAAKAAAEAERLAADADDEDEAPLAPAKPGKAKAAAPAPAPTAVPKGVEDLLNDWGDE